MPSIAEREAALAAVADPLPGRCPHEARRPLRIPGAVDGRPLLETLEALFPHHGRAYWSEELSAGRLHYRGAAMLDGARPLRAGMELEHVQPETVEPWVDADLRVLYEDPWVLALDKSAPLPVHPCGRYCRHTVTALVARAWPDLQLRPVHRLDAATTGVLLLAKSREVARHFGASFERREVDKVYLARVHGHPLADRFSCSDAVARQVVAAGGRRLAPAPHTEGSRSALTEVVVRRRRRDGTSLLEVRPRHGRTNQIRLHLAGLGHPIIGDEAYRRAASGGPSGPLTDQAIALHAWKLRVPHPQRPGEFLELTAPASAHVLGLASRASEECPSREPSDLAPAQS